jgi:hypothetical protein
MAGHSSTGSFQAPLRRGLFFAAARLRRAGRFFVVCLLPAGVLAAFQPPAPALQPFEIGIVRVDGALVPFAAYAGGRWTQAWPDANESAARSYDALESVPSVWRARGVPVPDRWRVWPIGGREPIDTEVTALTSVPAHCINQVALATNVPKQDVPPNVAPVRLLGLAIHGAARVGRIAKVEEQSDTWRQVEQFVAARFDRLERAQAAREPSAPSILEQPSPRPRLASLYRGDTFSPPALHFIARKQYRAPRYPNDRSCPGLTTVTGWLLPTSTGGFAMVGAKVFLTNCDEKAGGLLDPVGQVSGGANRTFWVMRELYYEGEAYVVFAVTPTAVTRAIASYGGGC